MRIFLTVLVLIFGFQSWTKADDIRDFEIEGISIGDSLLDHFDKQEIKNNLQEPYKSKKFIPVEFRYPKFKLKEYESIQTAYKQKDSKYKIYTISGSIFYPNNIQDCYKKQKKIFISLKDMFEGQKNIREIPIYESKHSIDTSGKSKVSTGGFLFDSGDSILVQCMDFSDIIPLDDELVVAIDTKEFADFLNTEAY